MHEVIPRKRSGVLIFASHIVQESAWLYLAPLQVGVATPAGAEGAVHTVRSWAHRSAGDRQKVLVKVDFENAFNTVSRAALLRQT